MFENINRNKQYVFTVVVTTNSFRMSNDLTKAMSQLVDLGVRILDVFTNMETTLI
jgi:hypothetical protein